MSLLGGDEEGAGVVGAGEGAIGDVVPDPVVVERLGLIGALPVVIGATPGLLLAVFGLLFQPAINTNAIKAKTASPAIQPHVPLAVLSRRSRGSWGGSVNRGSVMTFLLGYCLWSKPVHHGCGSEIIHRAVPGKKELTLRFEKC